jgi:4-diphosphocytidyl-2C-methyl-D-erythritol kinase
MVSGSGPTVVGLFDDPAGAARAAAALEGRRPAPLAVATLVGGARHNEARA